ncbi:Per1-like protein [Lactarius deliciosus]|nr:Per1-like protein [Lactarius deliciosus]
MRLYSLPLWLLALTAGTLASSGDRSNEFQRCLEQCTRHSCTSDGYPVRAQSLALRLTLWTCTDDCKYLCVHTLTDTAAESGVRAQQYYGKWPFWRYAGMQEPAAVAFSLANLLMHVLGADWLRHGVHPTHPMRPYYLTWAYLSVNAWIWSAVFHTRDTPLTEKLDYFSAALAILYALHMTVVRIFHLYTGTPAFPGRPKAPTTPPRMARFGHGHVRRTHCSTSASPRALITQYNTIFNVALGLTHNALWLSFALPGRAPFSRFAMMPRDYRPVYTSTAALAVALTTAATALELLDFPPLGRVLDAHALWHLATVPLAVMWYDFLLTDSQDAGWKGQRQ